MWQWRFFQWRRSPWRACLIGALAKAGRRDLSRDPDASDWDRSLAVNVPGQPGSPYYGNLLQLWAENDFFPLAFSRKAVEAGAHRLTLHP